MASSHGPAYPSTAIMLLVGVALAVSGCIVEPLVLTKDPSTVSFLASASPVPTVSVTPSPSPTPTPFIPYVPRDSSGSVSSASTATDPRVIQVYADVLNHPPTPAEASADSAAVRRGSLSERALRQRLANSAEAAFLLASAYQGFLLRPPTAAELSTRQQELEAGASGLQVASEIRALAPTARALSLPDTAHSPFDPAITRCYAEILLRLPDADGAARYTAELNAGASVASVRLELARTPESYANVDGLVRLYRARLATPAELKSFAAELAEGETLIRVANEIRALPN